MLVLNSWGQATLPVLSLEVPNACLKLFFKLCLSLLWFEDTAFLVDSHVVPPGPQFGKRVDGYDLLEIGPEVL